MKILQVLSLVFLLFFASYSYSDIPLENRPSEAAKIKRDLKTAIPDLPKRVFMYEENGKAVGFMVKNPDGIGTFRFGDKCYLNNGSPVKFLAPAMPKDVDTLDEEVYVEYTGGVQLDEHFRRIKEVFCPEHTVVTMPLKDYLLFGQITSRTTEEKEYLRIILRDAQTKQ